MAKCELFCVRLRELIDNIMDKNYKMTAPKQAEQIGIPYPTFMKYLNGETEPPISNLKKIADYYQVTTDYLLKPNAPKSLDIDISTSVNTTGLSDEIISLLNEELNKKYCCVDNRIFIDFVNNIINFCFLNKKLIYSYVDIIDKWDQRILKSNTNSEYVVQFSDFREDARLYQIAKSMLKKNFENYIESFTFEEYLSKCFNSDYFNLDEMSEGDSNA